MSVLAAVANGNLTSSSTWALIDATSYLNAESNNTALTTSYVESSSFTPGAITIDGIAVKLASRAGSPTGTMSLRLAQAGVLVTGTDVTVNVSDLPTCTATSGATGPVATAEGGWFFVKFGSPVTLLAATAYTLSAKTSSGSQVNLWRDGTAGNWSRYLRTTTTQAPVAGDDMIVVGEWTAAATVTARSVTMNQTAATDYGSNTTTQVTPAMAVGKGGTVAFGVGSGTNYLLQLSGYLVIYNGGTFTIGASGSEMLRTSTGTLQFDCAADGDFGVVVRNGGTWNSYGLSRTSGKNVVQTLLAADAAAAATALTVADDTGWLNGDVICLAPTKRTSSQYEKATLNADATSSGLSLGAGITNARDGVAPIQGEVGLLTRNVVVRAVTSGLVSFLYAGAGSTVAMSWTEMFYIGTSTAGKRGVEIQTTTGTFSMDYCSVHDCDASWWYCGSTSGNGFSITNSVFYAGNLTTSQGSGVANATSATWTVDHCMFCGCASNSTQLVFNDIGGTFTNNSISGYLHGSSGGLYLNEASGVLGTWSNITSHTNSYAGIFFNDLLSGTMTNVNCWRNASYGVYSKITGSTGFQTFVNCNFFGNGSGGVTMPSSNNNYGSIIFDTCTFSGDSSFAQARGLFLGPLFGEIYFYSCSMSVASGIKVAQATDLDFGSFSSPGRVVAENSIFSGTAFFANVGSLWTNTNRPFLTSQNHGQVANDNRQYVANSTTTASVRRSNSSTVYSSNPFSQQLTPASASYKFESSPMRIQVGSGATVTPTVQVQKDGSYSGAAPRLILKRQDSMGITADTVLATFSAGSGSWQGLSGTTPAAPQDGVFEFVVDCDGTAGNIFVGDIAA